MGIYDTLRRQMVRRVYRPTLSPFLDDVEHLAQPARPSMLRLFERENVVSGDFGWLGGYIDHIPEHLAQPARPSILPGQEPVF